MTNDQPRPTRGQQRILQLCCRVNYVLIGEQARPDEPPNPDGSRRVSHELRERATERVIYALTLAMVERLVTAGWLEVSELTPRDGRLVWTYRVTESGIAAANGPTRGES